MKKLISLALAAVLALGILSGCGKKADAAIQIAVPNDTTNEARALLLLPTTLRSLRPKPRKSPTSSRMWTTPSSTPTTPSTPV